MIRSPETRRVHEKPAAAVSPMTARQAELLYKSYEKMRGANEYFFPHHRRALIDHVTPLAEDIYRTVEKTQPRNFEVINVDHILNSKLPEVVAYAKFESLSDEKIREVVANVVADRLVNIAYFKNSGISLTDDPNFASYDREKKLQLIIGEVKKHDFHVVDNFYEKFPAYFEKIGKAATVDDLNAIQYQAESELNYSKEDRVLLGRIKRDLKERSRDIRTSAKAEVVATREEKSREFYEAFESALTYLRYCYPEEELGRLAAVAEGTIRRIAHTRDSLEFTKIFTPSRRLAELFWPIRLGRKINGLEKLGLSQEMVKKYLERIFDRKLRSEAAGYWFETSSRELPRYNLNPKLALIETVKSTLEAHHLYFSRSDLPVKMMIMVNDNAFIRLNLSPDATVQDIVMALARAKMEQPKLTSRQLYELKRESYKPDKRSKQYRKFYQHRDAYRIKLFGKRHSLPFTHQVDGDYIIRLTTASRHHTVEKNSPFSLFAVNSHRALIDIDLNSPKGFEFSVKLAHRYSDGRSAKPFFKHIYEKLEARHENSGELTLPRMDFIDQVEEVTQPKEVFPSLPIFEGNASSEYRDAYEKFKLEKANLTISPNAMRAAAISLANGVYDMHVLTAARVNPQTSGPYDNVQPVIFSLHPIRRLYEQYKRDPEMTFTAEQLRQVTTWVKKYNEAEGYAKKGLSTAAVLAAPTGRAEDFVAKISEFLHKGTRLLKHSSGMFSPLPELTPQERFENIAFYTASGDTYELEVDLNSPKTSCGTIGYSQSTVMEPVIKRDQVFYSVRKTPSQAQAAFRRFIEEDLVHGPHKERLVKSTAKTLTHLIDSWEKLIIGRMSLEDYIYELERTLEKLKKDSVCGARNLTLAGITSTASLQQTLNMVLKRDARETIDGEKLGHEKGNLYGFFNAVNQQL